MIAAGVPEQRPADAKLLLVDRAGHLIHWPRRDLGTTLSAGRSRDRERRGDAAGEPRRTARGNRAPRRGTTRGTRHSRRRARRPRSRRSSSVSATSACAPRIGRRHRRSHLAIASSSVPCGRLSCGVCTIIRGWSRSTFDGPPAAIWEGLARHGRPIQYAHVPQPLVLWDTWTPIAAAPVAFEPPSAGFALDWRHARVDASARRSLRHDYACGGVVVDGRSGTRRVAAVR